MLMTIGGVNRARLGSAGMRVQVRNARNPDSPLETASHAAPEPVPTDEADAGQDRLSERDVAILAFERRWWRNPGVKEEAIRAQFGFSAARYYQVLGTLVDSPHALAHDPMLIKRLHRMREARAEARARRSVISQPRTESD
jgi:hypothetical protein